MCALESVISFRACVNDKRFVVTEPEVPGLVTSSFSLALDDWFETWSWSSLSPATVIFGAICAHVLFLYLFG